MPLLSSRFGQRRRDGSFRGVFLAQPIACPRLTLTLMASGGVRQPVPARDGLHVRAWPPNGSDDADRDVTDPGEGAFNPVAAVQGELPGEGAAHDGVAGAQRFAE